MEAKDQACRSAYPLLKGSFVNRARCRNEIAERYQASANLGDGDLLNVYLAYRSKYAAMADAGQITLEDYGVAVTQAFSDFKEKQQQRRQSAAAADAARAAALAPMLMQMQRPQTAVAPAPYLIKPAPSPVYTNCMQTGLFTNCTSQ